MTGYVITKRVLDRWTYYLGKFGRWEGLINNAMVYESYSQVSVIVKNLRIEMPKENFDILS